MAPFVALFLTSTTPLPAQTPGETTTQRVPGTDIVLTLSFIPPGSFRMGSPVNEVGRDEDEGPTRTVRLAAFWMTAHEITHAQFSPFRFVQFDAPVATPDDLPFDVDAVTRPSPPYEAAMGRQKPCAGIMGRPIGVGDLLVPDLHPTISSSLKK